MVYYDVYERKDELQMKLLELLLGKKGSPENDTCST